MLLKAQGASDGVHQIQMSRSEVIVECTYIPVPKPVTSFSWRARAAGLEERRGGVRLAGGTVKGREDLSRQQP